LTDRDAGETESLRIGPWLPSSARPPGVPGLFWPDGQAGDPRAIGASVSETSGGAGSPDPYPLELLPADGSYRERGRWWVVLFPVAAIILLITIAVNGVTQRGDDETVLPQLSQPVVFPELGSPSLDPGSASAPTGTASSAAGSPSPSASRRPPHGSPPPGTSRAGRPVPAAPAPPPPPPAPGSLIVGIAGRCVEVAGGSSSDGTRVQLGFCSGAAHQRWLAPGDGTLRSLGKCLDTEDSRTSNRTLTVLYHCDGTSSQQWSLRRDATLFNSRSDRCLDAYEDGTSPGTPLIIFSCHGEENQRWRFA